jgi:hypothetical protein
VIQTTNFNFRDVLQRLGIGLENRKVNWAVGHILRKEAEKRGVPVSHPLTKKTDPSPTVGAPHCIAAYPMEFFPVAITVVQQWWGDKARQLDLFSLNGDKEDDYMIYTRQIALDLGRAGQQQTLDREEARWVSLYSDTADTYLRTQVRSGEVFSMEDVRQWSLTLGLPMPHHVNVWGAQGRRIVKRWRASGLVADAGAGVAKNAQAHGRLIRLYRKVSA